MSVAVEALEFQEELWDEGLWTELLAYMEEGRVIPIIGPSLYIIESEGRQLTVESYVAERLAAQLRIAAAGENPTLNGVVAAYLRQRGRREKLYAMVQAILRDAAFSPPPVLEQLADITAFNLYVTTSFDPLLEAAINARRFGGQPGVASIAYRPDKVTDLPAVKTEITRPTVYYLLGKLSASPNYVISDEDLLEYLFAWQSDCRPARLFDELEYNHLLLLGGNFSDWLARVFLRTAKRRRLSDPRDVLEILADDRSGHDTGLISFLKSFSTHTKIFSGNATGFVGELWTRWQQRQPDAAAPLSAGADRLPSVEMPDNAVFISYAREDLAAVFELNRALGAAGLRVWFDMDQIEAGDAWERKLRDNIRRCKLFVPVLSQNTETRREGVFRREWRYALDRDMNIDVRVPFIVPVVVDGTKPEHVPERFLEVHLTDLSHGRPTEAFVKRLKDLTGTL